MNTKTNAFNDHRFDSRDSAAATDIAAESDAAFTGHKSGVPAAVTDLEAAAYALLVAFDKSSQYTQHVVLNEFVPAAELYGMPLTIGAATLAQGIGAMRTATTAKGDAPDGCLSTAVDSFDAAAVAVIQAIDSADPDTKDAIYKSHQSLELPYLDQLDPLLAIAALAIAVNSWTQTDALGLTIEPWGDSQSGSPGPHGFNVAKATSTEPNAAKMGGAYLACYELQQGLPLVVGPFPDHDTAWRHLDGANVDPERYDRAWVQHISAPDDDALYPLAKLPGQCHASGCDQPGTTPIERHGAVTLLCSECVELID
jgi:hypothetical protein